MFALDRLERIEMCLCVRINKFERCRSHMKNQRYVTLINRLARVRDMINQEIVDMIMFWCV